MNETDYISGSRAAWLSMLHTCLRELGVDDPVAGQARWVSEHAQLRELLKEAHECLRDYRGYIMGQTELSTSVDKLLFRLEATKPRE